MIYSFLWSSVYQLNNAATASSESFDTGASHDRALVLLRETLQEVCSTLEKSLQPERSQPVVEDPVVGQMMASMLERYSQQLSTQVYELFKQKLEDFQQTKL